MPNLGKISSWSIRRKLFLLLLIVFLPTTGIIIASGIEHRYRDIETARNRAMVLVESLAAQQEEMVTATRQMLFTLAHLPEVRNLDFDACTSLFRELHEQNPFYSTIAATTPNGRIFAASQAVDPGSINISDRKHIRDVVATLDFSAGEYVVGKHTGVKSIHYGYPVLSTNKGLIAIVSAGVNLRGMMACLGFTASKREHSQRYVKNGMRPFIRTIFHG